MRLPFFSLVLALLTPSTHAAPPVPTAPPSALAAPDLAPVKKWIARQENFNSVAADFVQTRALRALRSPLSSPGHLWFVAPESFRWELGDPAKTIVLRKGEWIYVITPTKKRAERHAAAAVGKDFGMQSMAMMSFQFAKDFSDFQRKFETLSVQSEGGRCRLEILPRDVQARQVLKAIKLDIDNSTGQMLAFEILTRDGSALRNEFSDVHVNAKIDHRIFDFDFTGYEIIDAK